MTLKYVTSSHYFYYYADDDEDGEEGAGQLGEYEEEEEDEEGSEGGEVGLSYLMKEDIQVMYLPPVFNMHNQFSKTLQLDNDRFLL